MAVIALLPKVLGSQFTSEGFTGLLLANKIQISMDAKGRAFDNIFIERLWRSVKYEEVYLKDYRNGKEANVNRVDNNLLVTHKVTHTIHMGPQEQQQ